MKKRNLEKKKTLQNTTLTTHNTLPAHAKNYPLTTPHPPPQRAVSQIPKYIDKRSKQCIIKRNFQDNSCPVQNAYINNEENTGQK